MQTCLFILDNMARTSLNMKLSHPSLGVIIVIRDYVFNMADRIPFLFISTPLEILTKWQ